MRIDGQIAVVTGGTQGLGAAIARQLAEVGAAGIVTCGRNADTGCTVRFQPADLGRLDDCAAVIAAADAFLGRVDILVNVAGITDRGDILHTDEALFYRMFAVNMRAPCFLMQGPSGS